MKTIHNVAVQIVRLVDSGFPGWAECELVDAAGRLHVFEEKVPIFTAEDLHADSNYPAPGFVACEVLERFQNEKGQDRVRITTVTPYDIESTERLSEFTVAASFVSSTFGDSI